MYCRMKDTDPRTDTAYFLIIEVAELFYLLDALIFVLYNSRKMSMKDIMKCGFIKIYDMTQNKKNTEIYPLIDFIKLYNKK